MTGNRHTENKVINKQRKMEKIFPDVAKTWLSAEISSSKHGS
jgi:hypothetical protein